MAVGTWRDIRGPAWRFWSAAEVGVHYVVYRFAGKASYAAALASSDFRALVADFNKSWPEGVTRTRDIVTVAEARASP